MCECQKKFIDRVALPPRRETRGATPVPLRIAQLGADPTAKVLAQREEGVPWEQSTVLLGWAEPPVACHGGKRAC